VLAQVRCPEIDFRSTWKWALPVLDLIDSDRDYPEVYQTQASTSSSSTGDAARLNEIRNGMDHRAKEAYLKRMLAVAHQWQVRRRQIIPFHRSGVTYHCYCYDHIVTIETGNPDLPGRPPALATPLRRSPPTARIIPDDLPLCTIRHHPHVHGPGPLLPRSTEKSLPGPRITSVLSVPEYAALSFFPGISIDPAEAVRLFFVTTG
jgi:hypothetical protein